jgi:glucose/arabinose dehydrogenase
VVELLSACASAEPEGTFDGRDAARSQLAVRLRTVLTGGAQLTDVIPVPGHPDRAVVLGKEGTAWLGTPTPGGAPLTPWFTVPVATESELGLLSLAFAPDFAQSGAFVVHLNPAAGPHRTQLRRGHVDPSSLAGPTLGEVLFEVHQPHANHDGGQLAFGPDGGLYLGLGDGGGQGDPRHHGQDPGSSLGKILRFALGPTGPATPEVWATGVRNPWRFTFDPGGHLIVADVGQDRWEELDWVERGDNLGWSAKEGYDCFGEPPCGGQYVDPIWVYGHDEGVSITGGVVVTAAGSLGGRYVFGDFGSGRLWALRLPESRARVTEVTALGRFPLHPSAFARSPSGTAWVADYTAGVVYELVAP